MKKTATMFVNNITQMDHAFISSTGLMIGAAINLGGEIYGEVTEDEQVVIDFSACKKQIKSLIDDTPIGIDHKLVLFEGWSDYTLEGEYVVTPSLKIKINGNVTIIPMNDNSDPSIALEQYLAHEVSTHLSELHDTEITFTPWLDDTFTYPNPKLMPVFHSIPFNYAHGLKNSSSFGCMNIAHGHKSFIAVSVNDAVHDSNDHDDAVEDAMDEIVKALHNKIFVNKHDIVDSVQSYTSMSRGDFSIEFFNQDQVVLFDTDTTIENIVEYVDVKWGAKLKEVGVTALYISEGLTKGAMVKY